MSKGRKRKQGVKRVNGRISQRKSDVAQRRDETEREATETARQARIRVFGIDAEDAMSPDTATVVGRLKRAGELNIGQYRAALRYEALVYSFRQVIGTPQQRCASDLSGVSGRSGSAPDEDVERYQRIRQRHDDMQRAILDLNAIHRGSNFLAALDTIVMRDVDILHMRGDLRLALNELAHFFGCVEDDEMEVAA